MNGEGKAPATGLGLGHLAQGTLLRGELASEGIERRPYCERGLLGPPWSCSPGPRCPGMAVSGQFSCGDKITLESGPLRGVFTRLHMTVMQVYHWTFEILSTHMTWKSVLSLANRHISIFTWWQIVLFGDYYLKCIFHVLKKIKIFFIFNGCRVFHSALHIYFVWLASLSTGHLCCRKSILIKRLVHSA